VLLELVAGHAGLGALVDLAAGLCKQNDPGFGFQACGGVLCGKRGAGVYLNREVFAGVEELHEQGEVAIGRGL